MTITIPALSGIVLAYLMVFARVGAMVMLLPAIGERTVPPPVRLILALAISLALAPSVASAYPDTRPLNEAALAILLMREITIGVLIGMMSRLIVSALSVAGNLIANQSGLGYATAFDPTSTADNGAVVGNFISLLGTVVIFATNLHYLAIGAVAGSYHLIPPGGEIPTGDLAELSIRYVGGAFALGFQLAAPFLVFGFVINAAFGVMSRLMPQLQIFFIVMPVSTIVSFLLLALMLGTMMTLYLDFYSGQMHLLQ
jgi:flagellar biosynthesis protein FliR